MHIVQVIPHYLPAARFGGPQHVAHGLGRALIADGHHVSVCTTNLQNEKSDLDVPVDRPVDLDGVMVYYAPTCISRYWGYSPGLRRQADRLIRSADLVLIHAHYQYANWIGAKLARHHRKPYAWFAHGSLRTVAIAERGRFRKGLYLAILERANLRQASMIVFNAEEERDGSRYADRGMVLVNGIDPAGYQPLPPKGQFRRKHGVPDEAILLLFLGRLDVVRKGLDLLLPALALAAEEDSRLYLVLAGPDERHGQQALRNLASRLEIQRRVLLPGMLTGQEKLAVLADADALVLPSRSEGLSVSLLEALLVGLPVLVSDQVGLHRKVRELQAGLVVSPTVQQIADGLVQLGRKGMLLAMCGKATEWITTHHNWPGIARTLIQALERQLVHDRTDRSQPMQFQP